MLPFFHKHFRVIVLTLITICFLYSSPALAQYGPGNAIGDAFTGSEPLTESELNAMLQQPQLRIKLPGLEKFTEANVENLTTEDDEGNKYISIPYAGEYIAAIYRFVIAAIGIVSVIMIIIAGFQWVTSAGNSDNITKAKTRIEHALIGILLAVGSYLFLFTINPNLVKFRNLKVLYVQAEPIPDEAYSHVNDVASDSGPNIIGPDGTIQPPRNCSVPVPSSPSNLTGFDTNKKFLGQLDCNISSRTKNAKRPPSDVKMVILHLGFPKENVSGMISMWANDYKLGKAKKDKATKKIYRLPLTVNQVPIGSHYAAVPSGEVYQLADELHVMNHCCSENKISIGIDINYQKNSEGYFYTEEQYQNIAKLIVALSKKYNFPINDTTVRGHCELGTHHDPPNFKLNKLGKYMGTSFNLSQHNPKGQCSWDPSLE